MHIHAAPRLAPRNSVLTSLPLLPTLVSPCNNLQQERQGHIDTELATVISSISLACKQIAAAVGRSGISSLTGVAGTGENVQVRVLLRRTSCMLALRCAVRRGGSGEGAGACHVLVARRE